MGIKAEVKSGGSEVHLSGADAAHTDVASLQRFLNSRLNCTAKNHCAPKDSAATKAKCLSDLIEYKFGEDATKKTGEQGHVRIDAHLKEFATPERVQRLVDSFSACRVLNQCASNLDMVGRWLCVSNLAEGILRR